MKPISKFFFLSYFLFFLLSKVESTEFKWNKKTDFAGGKTESAVAFSLGHKGYVCCRTDANHLKSECWQYDPKEDKWKKMSDFQNEPRTGAVAFIVGEKAYVGTGLAGSGDTKIPRNDLWEYNPSKDNWTQKADLPGPTRAGAIGFSIADKGYIGLGTTAATGFLNDLWEYNPKSNEWVRKTDFPEEGRTDASVFVVGNSAYVLCGRVQKEIKAGKKSVWEYKSAQNKWQKKTDFPGAARLGATAFAIHDKGYIYAGSNGLSERYNDIWEFDAVSSMWIQKPDAACEARSYAFCFVIDTTAYVGTGNHKQKQLFGGSTGSNDFWSVTVFDKINYNAKLLLSNKDKKLPLVQQGVTLISNEKKVLQTTKTDNSGEFDFKKIDVDGKYEVVLDKNDKLPADASVSVAKPSGKIVQTLQKNADGQFAYEISKLDFLEEDDSYFNLQYFMKSSDKDITITENIYYPPSSWELSEEAQNILYQVIVSLNQYPNLVLEISSHTDAVGNDDDNMQLSEKRVKTVVDYIISNKIDSKRVSGKGYGETKILNRCKNGVDCTEEEHKVNRRTEFKFIKHE